MHESPGRAPLARARPVAGSRATPGEAENAPWGDRPGEADARARLQRGGPVRSDVAGIGPPPVT